MKKIVSVLALVAATFGANAQMHDEHATGPVTGEVAVKVSTLGLGVEYVMPYEKNFEIGIGANYLSGEMEESDEDFDLNADLRLFTLGAMGYYYPWDNGFNLNAGLFYNGNRIKLKAEPNSSQEFTFDGKTYSTDDIAGDVNGEVSFNKLAPYVGLGWKSGDRNNTGWAFNANAGFLFQGSPKVSLNAECGSALDAATCNELQSNIEAERRDAEDEASSFKAYPVISLGANYSF